MILLLAAAGLGADLAGVLRDPDGGPVPGAFVVAYDARFQFEFTTTDAAGAYALEDLPEGPWRLRVLPPMESDVTEVWYGGALGACQAEPIDLHAGERIVDMDLAWGATVAGILRDAAGQPVAGARIGARTLRAQPVAQTRVGFSDADGAFTVRGIPADDGDTGTFVLEVQGPGVPNQFVPGTYDLVAATRVVLAPEDTADVGEVDLLAGVSIGGAVLGPDGPVSAAEVTAFSASQTEQAPAPGGTWRIDGLPPGDVLVWATSDGLATTYWPDSPIPDARIPAREEGAVLDDIDLVLPAESAIEGRLVGSAFGQTSLVLFDEARTTGVGVSLEDDGFFRADALHPGTYLLYVNGADDGLVSDFLRDDAGEPRLFHADPADTRWVGEVPVPLGGRIVGVARDRYTGDPVYGATIVAVARADGLRRSATTGRDGSFALAGLVTGRWTLWAEFQAPCAGDPGFTSVYYPDRVNPTLGGVVDIEQGDAITWDPELAPDADRDGMDDRWEAAHGLDPSRDDGAEDPDGDGFSNLDEYLLGTDPNSAVADAGCGCAGDGSAWVVLVPLLAIRRRLTSS